ncbi:MFS transporter [Rhodococcus sp. X156]|uniref:MFS transporter n=1 Tax=Rhodococcus sp. X156 TaxID=2499145 RepID=UPI000FDB8BB2|nr:MFS transporter [Rhodococcus sp. X156]
MSARPTAAAPQATEAARHPGLVPALVFLGALVAVVSSLGAPLVPTVAVDYAVSLPSAQWSLTITLLAGAVSTPVLGRLGDGPHRRGVIIGALALIVLGCVLAAVPGSYPLLLVGRALQGVGLGLTPLAMAVARDHLTGARARSAVATLSVTTAAGVGLGYPLTALAAQHLGFHAAFWCAAAATSLVLVAVIAVVPPSTTRTRHRLDVLGATLMSLSLAAVLVAVSTGGQWGWFSGRVLGLLVVAVVLGAAWAWWELRVAHPLVDLRLLRNRAVLTADVSAVISGVGMYFLMATIILFVQSPTSTGYGLGQSVVVGALVLVPFSLCSVAASRLAVLIGRRVGERLVIPVGAGFFLLAMLMFLFLRHSVWQVCVVMGLAGLGVGCTFAAMPALIVRSVPVHETGSALGVNQVLKTVGGSMGSALASGVLASHTLAGAQYPENSGYSVGAVLCIGVWVLVGVLGYVLLGRSLRTPAPTDAQAPTDAEAPSARLGTR